MSERGFLIFSIFLLFFWNFLARVEYERHSGVKIFPPFSAYLIPFWLKIISERGFLIFSIFLLFFWNFLVWVEYERNSKIKLFSLFHGLSHPVLAKNNDGKRFFNFFNFFPIFFGIFLPESSLNGIRK